MTIQPDVHEDLEDIDVRTALPKPFPYADFVRQNGFAAYAEATKETRAKSRAQVQEIFRKIEEGTL